MPAPPGATQSLRGIAHPERAALALVVAAAGFHLLHAGWMDLTPREAFTWQCARHLDLSCLGEPPLAAWTVAASTRLLGTSARSVRLAAVLHSAAFSLFLFLAGRRLLGGRTALLGLAAVLAAPLSSLGQAPAAPEGPLLAGWAAALYFTVRAVDEARGPWLLAAFAAAGLACPGRPAGLLLPPLILAALLLHPRGRRLLATPWPWLGALAAAAALLPTAWALRPGGAAAGLGALPWAGPAAGFQPRLAARFLGQQALAASPVLLAAALLSSAAAALRWRDPAFRACALFSAPLLAPLLAASPFREIDPGAAAPAYPAALLAAAAFYRERPDRWRGLAAAALGVALATSAWLHLAPLWPALPFPAREDAAAGWAELAARVEAERARLGGDAFVVGCDEGTASELAFHLPGRPETQSASAFGEPGQYRSWLARVPLAGRDGLVVLDRRSPGACRGLASQACRPFEPLEPLPVRRGRALVTTFEIYRCRYPAALLGAAPGTPPPAGRRGRRPRRAAPGRPRSCPGGTGRSRSGPGRRGRAAGASG